MTDQSHRKAWATRRKKYGTKGHGGCYRAGRCAACQSAHDTILRLHNEGVLSEGQASKVLKIGRVELRTRAQAHPSFVD